MIFWVKVVLCFWLKQGKKSRFKQVLQVVEIYSELILVSYGFEKKFWYFQEKSKFK